MNSVHCNNIYRKIAKQMCNLSVARTQVTVPQKLKSWSAVYIHKVTAHLHRHINNEDAKRSSQTVSAL